MRERDAGVGATLGAAMTRPPDDPSASSRTGPAVVAAGAAALVTLGLVAYLAAGAGTEDAQVSAPGVDVPAAWFDVILGVIGGLTLVVWLALLVAAVTERSGGNDLRPSRTIPGMLLAAALLWFMFTVWTPSEAPTISEPPPSAPPGELGPELPTDPTPTGTATSTGWLLAGLGLVMVTVAIAAWSSRSKVRKETGDGAGVVQRRRHLLIGLLDDALTDLRDHPDPRAAVIAAWARLENALTTVDVLRVPGDTPSRYLAKVLVTVEASATAVEGFTGAFERAMFSPDRITEVDQAAAVDALVAVRDELHLLSDRTRLASQLEEP